MGPHDEALDRRHATMDTKLMIDVKMQPNGTQQRLKSIDEAAIYKKEGLCKDLPQLPCREMTFVI